MNCAATITRPVRSVSGCKSPGTYPDGLHWFAVRVKSKCERRVIAALSSAGYRCFVPEMTRWVSHARTRTVVARPLFPCYVFVEVDPNGWGFGSIGRTDGVDYILSSNGWPLMLPGAEVEELLGRQLRGEFDYAREKPPTKGARVCVVDGKYDGMVGIIAGDSNRHGFLVKIAGERDAPRILPMYLRPVRER